MTTLTLTKDQLRDAINHEMNNPIAEERIIQLIKHILHEGGKVTCTLENIEIPIYLSQNGDIQLGAGIEK
ncbi:hypothetical protein [Sulfuricurvum sp.]|uniref:hypothetical protein n=1 Tax=Sulfuricurvum sp. TaxID=2025608 RepID=UPI0026151BFC|nr:hypothetical protein [Sulfuricurvum sp.]MDD3597114.1 hypothetical protein [Sulfuricurvum sp.]